MTPVGVVKEDSVPQDKTNYTMDFLNFTDVSFNTKGSVGQLCEELNNIVGQGISYDTYHVQNTKWLQFVHDIITDMNNDKVHVWLVWTVPQLCSWYSKHRKRNSFLHSMRGKVRLCKIHYKMSGPNRLHGQIVIKNQSYVCLGRTFSANLR